MANSFLGDTLNTLFERRQTAFWRRQGGQGRKEDRTLRELCLALLDAEGEVSGLSLAKAILSVYQDLDAEEKLDFFLFLNEDLEIDAVALSQAVSQYKQTGDTKDYQRLSDLAEPRRQELLRRLNQSQNATHTLVEMRADLLSMLKAHPALKRTDHDFGHLLRSWFNRGFLVLRQITWETPASVLEKIVQYEAVHAIDDWDDLRRRLYPPDRRCFAYFHPTMPDEPLIFVEVALTRNVPDNVQTLLSEDRDYSETEEQKVAVFYSISNCQQGLKGISFGNLLIKQVVDELRHELPGLETFVTLSPIPKLNTWLAGQTEDPNAQEILTGRPTAESVASAATTYLLEAKGRGGVPYDPVARFHLGNGAQIYAVHGEADTSVNGLKQSSGAMVNYHYDLTLIEQNHEKFKQLGEIATAPGFPQNRTTRKIKEKRAANS